MNLSLWLLYYLHDFSCSFILLDNDDCDDDLACVLCGLYDKIKCSCVHIYMGKYLS